MLTSHNAKSSFAKLNSILFCFPSKFQLDAVMLCCCVRYVVLKHTMGPYQRFVVVPVTVDLSGISHVSDWFVQVM